MRRRSVLTATGSTLLALAGCLGSGEAPATSTPQGTTDRTPETTDPPESSTPTPEPTTRTPAVPLAVSVDAVQRGTVWLDSPDSTTVRGAADERALFLDVSRPESVSPADAPARDEFGLRFDGREYRPIRVDGTFGLWRARTDTPYAEGSGLLLFDLPDSGDAAEAALTWPGGEWPLPEATRKRLAAPVPPLSVDVSVPETVPLHESVPLSFEVTNQGEVATTFVAAIDRAGPYVAHYPATQLRFTVGPGETVTETVDDDFMEPPREEEVGDGDPDATYYVAWAGGDTERRVRVVDA